MKKTKEDRKTLIDKIVKIACLSITLLSASVIVFICVFILIKGLSPFIKEYNIGGELIRINFFDFLFGTTWSDPYYYGIGFIIIDTLYIVFLALLIAVPISVLTALFIVRKAPTFLKHILTSTTEVLASIPSIVYGIFGAGVITSFVKWVSNIFNYQTAGGKSVLASVIVLAIMIIPTMTLISITSIKSVKSDIINGSIALGASKTQTDFKVVLTSAKSGIFAGIILGLGRALGEATAITMVIGNAANGPTFNILDISRTLTSTMLLGLKETTGLQYDIRFSVAIFLIAIILGSNILLNYIKKRIGKIS